MNMFVLWALLVVGAQVLVSLIAFFLRKKKIKPALRVIIIIVKVLLAVAFAGLVMAGPVQLRPVQPFLVALYAVLLMDAVADCIYSIFLAIKKTERKFAVSRVLSLVLGILFFVYGTVNMQTVRPNYHTYYSDLLKTKHKFVFISDMHVGSAQPFSVTKKTIADIQSQKPDFIILGGDITDDYTTKEEMEETYCLFGKTGIPVYYIFGNHEVVQHPEYMKNGIEYTEKDLVQTLNYNGIKVLVDEHDDIAPDLVLFGRQDDASELRKTNEELENLPVKKFVLVADHQPVKPDENIQAGADLIVAGHTHAGQFFPLKWLYAVIGKVEGDYKIGDVTMNISSGASGWRVPFRTDSHCHYEVITLAPDKK